MQRFFVAPESISGETVLLAGAQAHQVARVLRLKPGWRIIVLDNSGWEYEAELQEVSPQRVIGRVTSKVLSRSEPKAEVTLYQSLLKGSKFEYVLQKSTEIGVTSFAPMVCRRCVADAAKVSEAKLARWREIIREAAEQSRRGRLPTLRPLATLEQACKSADGLKLLPWEGAAQHSLRTVLREQQTTAQPLRVSLLIGPEGGFEPAEVEFSRSCGVIPVTLGKRTLRAETAAVVAASLVLYELGDIGG